MRFIYFLFAIFLTTVSGRASDTIDDFIDAEMANAGAPGLSYAIVERGQIQSGARGEIRRGSDELITPDTLFLIGSISKSFTAVGVMQLFEKGSIDLESEISAYLPSFVGRPSGKITVRQLLSHTSGYSTVQGNSFDTSADHDLSRQVEKMAQWSPKYAAGSKWQYSNANYVILGAIIEAVSGQEYARYIESKLFLPIGMTRSFVAEGRVTHPVAIGHRPWFVGKWPYADDRSYRLIAPAGGIIATADDMAKYLAVMVNGEDDIISAQSKSAMMRPASATSPYYGLGWSVNSQAGVAFHAGTSPGVETLAVLVPDEHKGAIVMVNGGSGMGFGETINLRNGIASTALGLEYAPETGQFSRKLLFLTFIVLPFVFIASALNAVINRRALRSKSGIAGAFSLWFPLIMTLGLAWCAIYLVPSLFGVSIKSLILYLPDMAWAMVITAITGVCWAVLRLGVYYTDRNRGP
ncbi:serine hydrolase domain-containing protein [Hyphococcus sp. DH-69]|uniref:serine hydrolase domain-containing protein n=1 Tax=Hyphococcus formosus TaxID=3143534 RepID=UPI00398AA279